jgi:predicted N-acetyltransferase YhbS
MEEMTKRMGNYFLIAELDSYVVGMIRGCYDGSRALLHQMAVDKKYQKLGIGKLMIYELASRFKSDGAKSISVTSTEKSKAYYSSLGFSDLPITLMVCFDIGHAIKKTKPSNLA